MRLRLTLDAASSHVYTDPMAQSIPINSDIGSAFLALDKKYQPGISISQLNK